VPPSVAPAAFPSAVPSAPHTANAQAFQQAVRKMAADHPELISQPGWEKLRQYLAAPA